MASKELVYKLKFVTENGQEVEKTASSINEISDSVSQLETKLKGSKLGSDEFKNLQGELKKSKGALDEAQASTMSFSDKIKGIPGPIGAAAQGVMGLGKSFMALIANPIGAAIAGIALVFTTLYKALTSTEKGTFALKEVMAALSGVLNPIIKVLQNVALVLVDGILAGIEGVQKALSFLGFDQFAKASADASKLAKEINRVEEAEGDLAVERAQQNKELAEAREIISDTTKSLSERTAALDEVKKSEESLAAKETKLAQDRLKNIKEQIKQQGASKDLLDAEEQALIQLSNTQQNQSAIRRKNIKAEQALVREAAAEEKAQEEERKKRAADAEAKRKEKLQKAKEAADYERQLNLDLITDEQEKALKSVEIAKTKELETINALAVSETKKSELRAKLEEKTQNDISKIKQTADEKQKAEQKRKDDEAEANRLKVIAQAQANVDTLLQIEAFKYDTEEELATADLEKTISLMRQKTDLLLQNDKLTADERLLIETQYTENIRKLTESQLSTQQNLSDKKIAIARSEAQAAANVLSDIASVAGETTEVGKIAALAAATINTYLSASQAASDPTLPAFLKPFAVAAAIALGLKQVAAITAVNTEIAEPKKMAVGGIVQGQGSGTMDNIPVQLSSGESVMNARSTAMFRPTLSLMSQLGGGSKFDGGIVSNGVDAAQMEMISGIKQKNQQPVKAYVVASQASNQIQLDRQVKSRSLV